MPRILILTASFGEGHNSAARALHSAFESSDRTECEIVDLYARSIPLVDKSIQSLYSLAINQFPGIWQAIFSALDRPGLMESMLWTGAPMKRALDDAIAGFHPDAIISTYPVYAYLFRSLQKSRLGLQIPFFTVITDSIGVNSAWHRCLSDGFFVTDVETAELLGSRGVPREILHPLGFPISSAYTELPGELPEPPPWKLLFMPSTQVARTLTQIRAILDIPEVSLTVLAGKHHRIFDEVNASGVVDGDRCQLVGWTDSMPQLMARHHAFIGKAGGAIVQETLAAHCPFIVSHLVPGQEEGNIALINRLAIGASAHESLEALTQAIRTMIADNGAQWRSWRENLRTHGRSGAADRIATHVLERLGENSSAS